MLYPKSQPFDEGYFKVSEIHEIYYYRHGNPEGEPVVFLHGGPGGGINEDYHQYFDPKKYHIVLFDQRGCGKSKPFSELEENNTWNLVSDIEALRNKFNIKKWAVFGGSWGSCLALAYASKHPEQITAMFLRGIFTLRESELKWFYQEGASHLFPDAWEKYLAAIPENEREDLMLAYHKRLTGEDKAEREKAAKAWSIWEASTSKLYVDPKHIEEAGEDQFADAFARIESHYFHNKGFFNSDNYLLDRVETYRNIPSWIVQGRYAVVCPSTTAYELHKRWPEANFQIIPDAGHSLSEKGITEALIKATDEFVNSLPSK
ncbi:MAG: prolyl aminopeptidase [Bdellovibrionota bacterium]